MSWNWKKIGRIAAGVLTGGLSEGYFRSKDAYESSPDGPVQQREWLESEASRLGISVEDYIKANPQYSDVYKEAYSINSFGDAFSNAINKVGEKVEAYVDNATGERDVKENAKNRDFQSSEADKARAWEAEQAQAAREWDSIGAQMERAAAVGVNPVSVAMQNGGINSAATTSIPSSPGIPSGSSGLMHSGALDIASAVFSGIGTFAEQRLKQSQSDDIVIMRQYNVAEKIANTDRLRNLSASAELSNVAQSIQNQWLDVMNQATYDGMLLENGVKRESILRERSVAQLNVQQIASIQQDMQLSLERFNATLPLEVQLKQEEIDLTHANVQQVYTEISYRHLQAVEQENRNRQSAAEAGSSEVSELIARQTYEDAINAFHNDMVAGAAAAGIALNDYMYYGASHISAGQLPGAILNYHHHRKNENVRDITDNNLRGIYP